MTAQLLLDDPSIALRPSEPRDLEAITEIYAHYVLHTASNFELEPPTLSEMTRRHAALVEGGYPYIVAEQGGEIVGYAYASSHRPRKAYDNTVEDSIYLRPGTTGRGLGGVLLSALIEECTARGFRQMIAVIGDTAHTASIRLHEKHGFRQVGILEAVGYKHGRWIDVVMLQRRLGEGDRTEPHLKMVDP